MKTSRNNKSKPRITCPKCGYTNKLSSKERGERVRAGLLKSDKKIGRPISFDIVEAKRLKKQGLSFRAIARQIGAHHVSVSRFLK